MSSRTRNGTNLSPYPVDSAGVLELEETAPGSVGALIVRCRGYLFPFSSTSASDRRRLKNVEFCMNKKEVKLDIVLILVVAIREK
jgi:hypothetical protein